MNIDNLIQNIQHTHAVLKLEVSKTINSLMTIRNWLIGFYIIEFEQNGEDRARYGDNLINILVDKLKIDIKGISATNLRNYRQFYSTYPELVTNVNEYFIANSTKQIHQTASDTFNEDDKDKMYDNSSKNKKARKTGLYSSGRTDLKTPNGYVSKYYLPSFILNYF